MEIYQIAEQNNTMEDMQNDYPRAGKIVDGLEVLDEIPNLSSIRASLEEYSILPDIRAVPISGFSNGYSYSVSENQIIKELAHEIEQSKQIAPIIVVIDDEGPYILEGSHRIDALYRLGKKEFPALVVIDRDNIQDDENE